MLGVEKVGEKETEWKMTLSDKAISFCGHSERLQYTGWVGEGAEVGGNCGAVGNTVEVSSKLMACRLVRRWRAPMRCESWSRFDGATDQQIGIILTFDNFLSIIMPPYSEFQTAMCVRQRFWTLADDSQVTIL